MSNRAPDLSDLMRRARTGDAAAYRELLVRVAAWLRPIARRGLARAGRSVDDLEDVVQETLLAMHMKRDTWNAGEPLEPWVRAIVRHKLIDHLRRRGFHDHLDLDLLGDSVGGTPEPEPERAIDQKDLLARLTRRQREIVIAVSIEGRTAREVGERLGMSEGAVRVALHRALKSLAAAYQRGDP